MRILSATTIGSKISEALGKGDSITVQGITSLGIFLECQNGWMVFLSGEVYRGPLTINVPGILNVRNKIQRGSSGPFDGRLICFQESSLGFDLSAADVWRFDLGGTWNNILRKQALGYFNGLDEPVARSLMRKETIPSPVNPKLITNMWLFPDLLRKGDLTAIIEKAEEVLGLGAGLTPEGDDFLIGIILYLRIVKEYNPSSLNFDEFSNKLIKLAEKKTTRLSANLIACAAEGQVDERIGNFARAVFSGRGELTQAVKQLLSWGNTSGQMVMAGLLVGILSE